MNKFNSPEVIEAVAKVLFECDHGHNDDWWNGNAMMRQSCERRAQAAITAMLEQTRMSEEKANQFMEESYARYSDTDIDTYFSDGYIQCLRDLGLITEDTTVKE